MIRDELIDEGIILEPHNYYEQEVIDFYKSKNLPVPDQEKLNLIIKTSFEGVEGYVYKYIDNNDICFYVGQTECMPRRHREHMRERPYKIRSWKCYIYPCATPEELIEVENELIDFYRPELNRMILKPKRKMLKDTCEWQQYDEHVYYDF